MNKKIIFTSGGTGGHILPAINMMKYFSRKDYDVLLVTDSRGKNFIKDYPSYRSYTLYTDTPIKKNFIKLFLSLFFILFSIIYSIIILLKEKPKLIFGFGGYVSFPISFTSKLFNIPLVIYENNVILGKANRYLLPITKKVFLAKEDLINLPKKYENKICKVGYILNENIINYSFERKNLDKKIFSILVLGGSQGAEIFGTVIPEVVKMIKDEGYEIEINQQCVKFQKKNITEFYQKNNIKNNVFEFKENILDLISFTDLAISRCGASTMAELSHTFTPFVAVPIPNSIGNHQYLNAKYYEKEGNCWLLEQKNFNSKNLFKLIIDIVKDKKKLENFRNNMKKNDNKNTCNNIENIIKEIV